MGTGKEGDGIAGTEQRTEVNTVMQSTRASLLGAETSGDSIHL